MFERVRDVFKGIDSLAVTEQGSQVDDDLRLAIAVILLDMAQADGNYSSDEGVRLYKLIEREFGLSNDEIHTLLEKAGMSVGGEKRLDHFVKIINSYFDDLQKQRILSGAWEIVSADSELSQQEAKLAVTLKEKLGLSMEQSLRARKLAEGGVDLGDTTKLIHHTSKKD